LSNLIPEYQARTQNFLNEILDQQEVPSRLNNAMRYSTLAGGKRFRALLVYGAGLAVKAPIAKLDVVAAAVECIHAYSLIHDDLPAMDDDDLRRGKATCHIEYDEATAILAGDALLSFAFEIINRPDSPLSDKQCRTISHELSNRAGPIGMVGGQMLDIQATGQSNTKVKTALNELENIHRRKTGDLITAATLSGAYCSETIDSEKLKHLSDYSSLIGLAFQVIDDILDIESSTEELGKQSGADQELGKATYPSLIGLEESKKLANKLYQEAMVSLASISDNNPSLDGHIAENTALLQNLADLVIKRKN